MTWEATQSALPGPRAAHHWNRAIGNSSSTCRHACEADRWGKISLSHGGIPTVRCRQRASCTYNPKYHQDNTTSQPATLLAGCGSPLYSQQPGVSAVLNIGWLGVSHDSRQFNPLHMHPGQDLRFALWKGSGGSAACKGSYVMQCRSIYIPQRNK